MDITGIMRIYRSEYEGRATYSTTVSKKDQFNNYENLYLSVQLPKDVRLENNSKINVTKGFLSFYKTKQGFSKVKVVVQEFEPIPTEEQIESAGYEETPNYYGNDLPF